MTLMSATATSTQNIFTGQILGYDARHNADLNWFLTAGIAVGTAVFYLAVTRWKWRVKSVLLTGFVSFMLYQVSLYFLIDPSTEKYMLYIPVLLKGSGVSLVYTSLTYALAGCVTFDCYFEAMCVIGFIRTSFGGPMGSAIVTRLFRHAQQDNTGVIGGYMDAMYSASGGIQEVYGEFMRQITMVSIKEVYGYAAIAATVIVIAVMASDYRRIIGNGTNRMLKLSQIWRLKSRDYRRYSGR